MNPQHLFKNAVFILLSTLLTTAAFAQKVTDPSTLDPTYNAKKIASGIKSSTYALTKKNSTISPPIQNPCNIDQGCFIPLDNSYIEVPRNDDGYIGPINLPFTFNLYGSTYNQVWINTNGNLTFTGGYSGYVAAGFPINIPMVAAFWQDVDTRNPASGPIYYKVSPTHLIVTWDSVGYFNQHADKLNTFQIIIGTQGDPLLGSGNNVKFSYEGMNWALPDGTASFGPATVGANKGDGSAYFQVGRFDKETCDYDGPSGNNDGVGYLEYRCFGFNATGNNGGDNIPPSVSGFPPGDSTVLNIGDSVNLSIRYIGPEPGQTITTTVDTTGVCGINYTIDNGEVSTVNMHIQGALCNVGRHIVAFTATDDGTPPQTSRDTLLVIVNPPNQETPPYFDYTVTPANDSTISVSTGETVTFTVKAKDNDAGDNVTLTATGLPSSSTITPMLPTSGNPVSAKFKWTPKAGDVGTYELQFTATDNAGETTTTNVMIAVSASTCNPPLRSFIYTIPTEVGGMRHTIYKGYGPQSVLLTAIPLPFRSTPSDKFMWDNGSKLPVRLVSPNQTTRYDVNITDINGCVSHSAITIHVIDARCGWDSMNVKLCYYGTEVCVTKDSVAAWLKKGAKLGSCNMASEITSATASAASTAAIKVQPSGTFTVYPNPARNTINLKWNITVAGDAKINIMDLQGRVLISQVATNATQSIDISKLSGGVYMAQLSSGGRQLAISRFTVSK